MMKEKKLVFLCAAVALLSFSLVFAGCSKKEAASVSGGKTVIKYWYPWGGDSEVWDKWRMAEFEKLYPEYVIEATYVPEGAGVRNGKLMAAINSGDVPDIVVSDAPTQSYALATQGAFEPIDDALKEIGFDPSRANQGLLPYMKWDGVTYIYPQNTDVTLLFYRADLLREAGLNGPPKTIEELDAYAEKLTVRNGQDVTRYGFIPWLDAGADPSTWTFQFNADVYDESTNKVTLANAQVAKVYEWQRGYAQKADPERMRSFTSALGAAFSPDHAFMQGKVAMTAIGNWFCEALRQYAPDIEYAVAPLPVADPAIYGSCALAGNVFFVPKGAKNIVGAVLFANFCQSAAIVEDNNRVWRSLGIYRDSVEGLSLYKAGDPVLKTCIDITFNPHSSVWALSPVTAEMDDKLRSFTDVAIYSQTDIVSSLKDIEASLQSQVDRMLR
ncbi:MAG: extracellular solute-binding protein [Spirochaetaceae bacterium]|jgi:multiple sugar transport system substrate-binding protein|nr:extracellular solute-binding protein [Spirochaetaceae bacterium]